MFYPLFPGTEAATLSPEAVKGFLGAAKKKFDTAKRSFTSELMARYANIFARAGDGEEAYGAIVRMVRTTAMNNLVFAAGDCRKKPLRQIVTAAADGAVAAYAAEDYLS